MKSFEFWRKWLFFWSVVIILFGVSFALFGLLNVKVGYINNTFWEEGAIPLTTQAFQSWIFGVYSAMGISFGLFIAYIVKNPFKKKQRWSWNCLVSCISVWFGIDTFFSVYWKMYTNGFNNLILFVLLMFPLLVTKKEFSKE